MKVIHVLRKPCSREAGTVASNVLKHGTGALNVDGCRIATSDNLNGGAYSGETRLRAEHTSSDRTANAVPLSRLRRGVGDFSPPSGRWPANVILTEGPAVESFAAFGEKSSGVMVGHYQGWGTQGVYGSSGLTPATCYADNGSAARYFQAVKQTNQVGEP